MSILIGLVIYVVLCYIFIGGSLAKSPGPGGFGLLFVPFAPLLLPLALFVAVKERAKDAWWYLTKRNKRVR